MEEEWREVPGYPGYFASSLGRIRGRSGAILRGRIDRYGYQRITCYVGNIRLDRPIHQLVTLAWVGARPTPLHEVGHRDGVRLNNLPSNLRWVTDQENADDRRIHGTHPIGEQNPRAKLTYEVVKEIRQSYRPYKRGLGFQALATKYGVAKGLIVMIIKGKIWKTYPGLPPMEKRA